MAITIVSRSEWGARPPKHRNLISLPTPKFYLHHSASSGTDETAMRAIQNFHMDTRGWSDIAYSFLIDNDPGDIDIFEGRGAGVAGGHTAGQNTVSHALCIIGNFTKTPPHDETLQRTAELVAHGHGEGWWPLGFTGGHRDAPGANTTCPGDAAYKLISEINAEAERIYQGGGPDMAFTPAEEKELKGIVAAMQQQGTDGGFINVLIPLLRAGLVTKKDLDAAIKGAGGSGIGYGATVKLTKP